MAMRLRKGARYTKVLHSFGMLHLESKYRSVGCVVAAWRLSKMRVSTCLHQITLLMPMIIQNLLRSSLSVWNGDCLGATVAGLQHSGAGSHGTHWQCVQRHVLRVRVHERRHHQAHFFSHGCRTKRPGDLALSMDVNPNSDNLGGWSVVSIMQDRH